MGSFLRLACTALLAGLIAAQDASRGFVWKEVAIDGIPSGYSYVGAYVCEGKFYLLLGRGTGMQGVPKQVVLGEIRTYRPFGLTVHLEFARIREEKVRSYLLTGRLSPIPYAENCDSLSYVNAYLGPRAVDEAGAESAVEGRHCPEAFQGFVFWEKLFCVPTYRDKEEKFQIQYHDGTRWDAADWDAALPSPVARVVAFDSGSPPFFIFTASFDDRPYSIAAVLDDREGKPKIRSYRLLGPGFIGYFLWDYAPALVPESRRLWFPVALALDPSPTNTLASFDPESGWRRITTRAKIGWQELESTVGLTNPEQDALLLCPSKSASPLRIISIPSQGTAKEATWQSPPVLGEAICFPGDLSPIQPLMPHDFFVISLSRKMAPKAFVIYRSTTDGITP